MLLLLHSTLYFRLHFGLRQPRTLPESDTLGYAVLEQMRERLDDPKYKAEFWWQAVTWGTAAVALHNFQQSKEWHGDSGLVKVEPLKLDDDPVTYLGVLVDIMQEWDRYSTSRNSVFTGDLPVSSVDVQLGVVGEVVRIDYGSKSIAKKVRDGLSSALVGWDQIVSVTPN
jgi:hypothetical protein